MVFSLEMTLIPIYTVLKLKNPIKYSLLTLFPFLPFHSRKPTHFLSLRYRNCHQGSLTRYAPTEIRDILFILDFSLRNTNILVTENLPNEVRITREDWQLPKL